MASNTTRTAVSRPPFLLTINEVQQELQVADLGSGLNAADAQRLLDSHGHNSLNDEEGVKWLPLLMKQISNAMILVSCRSCRY